MYRGNKENDLILRSFSQKILALMTDQELTSYELFLEESDTDIQKWLMKEKPYPKKYALSFIKKLETHYESLTSSSL